MKNLLLFVAIVTLFSACGLADEKEAAEAVAKDLGAAEFSVADSTVFENKGEHPTLILNFKDPKLITPELDPVYLSAKAAYNFANKLGMDKAASYHNVIVKLGIKGYIYSNTYSVKTLNGLDGYYNKAKNFVIAITKNDSTAMMAGVKAGVISYDDLVQVLIMDDDQKLSKGKMSDIKPVGFEETHSELTGRDVMAVRMILYRQNIATEAYNFIFDRADQKIVGLGWDILKSPNELNVPEE